MPAGIPAPFARVLRRLRLRAALTQGELAERSGLSVEAISALERGHRRHPRRATLALLADALGLAAAERHAFLEPRPLPRRGPPTGLAPPSAPAGSLRRPPTRLIGREAELELASELLRRPEVRLLTISGPAGVGKSRLALELAGERPMAGFEDVVLVPLAALPGPDLVGGAIAGALAAAGGPASDVERLVAHLGPRRVLLVLDDFERLVPAGPLLAELISRCPRLLILVTSRWSLRLRGEHELSLHPLRLPDARDLFMERALAVSPDVALTVRDGAGVAEICRSLDGLPLALELAAPWVRGLSPEALLTQLRERPLGMLIDGPLDVPAHQRTMRDALRRSYDLLSEDERALLRRLAVFDAAPTLRDMAAVCQAAGDLDGNLVQLAAGLVGKHLVCRLVHADGPRFGLLETTRAFGREMLDASGEAAATARAHSQQLGGTQ